MSLVGSDPNSAAKKEEEEEKRTKPFDTVQFVQITKWDSPFSVCCQNELALIGGCRWYTAENSELLKVLPGKA